MGLAGRPKIPADKSISHRAALLAAIAEGQSEIVGYSHAADPQSTLRCLSALGVRWREEDGSIHIEGRGGDSLRPPAGPLDCGNSGTTMRLLAGLLAGQSFSSTLEGDSSLSARPMERIAEPLRRMGAQLQLNAGRPPVQIAPARLAGITYELPVASAQVKSAILLAGMFASGETTVIEPVSTRDHTERMLGLDTIELDGVRHISVTGSDRPPAGLWAVPRDFSAAAYFLVAGAIVQHCAMEFVGLGLNPTRTGLLDVLQAMGANVSIRNVRERQREPIGDVWMETRKQSLTAVALGGPIIPNIIDEIPVLAVAAAFAEGRTTIRDAGELRHKESDRLAATTRFLRDMGARVEEFDDGLAIDGGRPLHGCTVDPEGDHRIAMAAAVAGLGASGETRVLDADCVGVSFPGFWDELASATGASD